MNSLQRHFINQFQGGFPVVGHPYTSVAARLGTDEATLISMIENLLEQGLLSRFGPIYDAHAMGGGLTLAAMIVPEVQFDSVAQQVNARHEVAHNYRRDHEMNMWFVIATDAPAGIDKIILSIETETGLTVYNFPKQQEFYLGLWLQLDERDGVSTRSFKQHDVQPAATLNELDRQIIHATQGGLPLLVSPYAAVAAQISSDEETVIKRMQVLLDAGVIRRIGAIPNHYKLGLHGNGMTVWDVPDGQLEALGMQVGQLDYVSHCYARPRHLPQWPYNLFAMLHGRDRGEVNIQVNEISDMLGKDCRQHEVLFSSAILKKTGLRLAA